MIHLITNEPVLKNQYKLPPCYYEAVRATHNALWINRVLEHESQGKAMITRPPALLQRTPFSFAFNK